MGKAKNIKERLINEHIRGLHVRGQSQSTLRQSLGCLLSKELDLCLMSIPDCRPGDFTYGPEGEERLTNWMRKHARVSYQDTGGDYIEAEQTCIRNLILPLNIAGNKTSVFGAYLSRLRSEFRRFAPVDDSTTYPTKRRRRKIRKQAYAAAKES